MQGWIESDEGWAVAEFGEAELGDPRRTLRLVQLATVLGERPNASLPEASGGAASAKAAYRFFDNDQIDPDAILQSHVHATCRRMASLDLVLVPNDTTELDLKHHPATEGLGAVGTSTGRGLLVHTCLPTSVEGVPLGILAQQRWIREEPRGMRESRKERPIEEKESNKWLKGLEAVIDARAQCPDTRFVLSGDRESDVYDLFLKPRPQGVELLVRASWNRAVRHPQKYLWETMAAEPVSATASIEVPRREGQAARTATLSVRYKAITLKPPKHRPKEKLPSIELHAVWAVEEHPPAGIEPLEWMLLSTMPVSSTEEALERLQWYARRWGIEVWHKVLKSGCRIEERQFKSRENIERALALYSVIAWRILYAIMLSRAVPDAPCTALLEPEEWQALYCSIHQIPTPPSEVPSLRQAVRWIAMLGGFLGRKSDGEPGPKVLWQGFQRLVDLAAMYRIMRSAQSPPASKRAARSRIKTCG